MAEYTLAVGGRGAGAECALESRVVTGFFWAELWCRDRSQSGSRWWGGLEAQYGRMVGSVGGQRVDGSF